MIAAVLPARGLKLVQQFEGAPPFPCGTVEWSQCHDGVALHTGASYFHQERWEMLLELGKDSGIGFGVV